MSLVEKEKYYLSNMRIGEILINQGMINSEQLKKALQTQKIDNKKKCSAVYTSDIGKSPNISQTDCWTGRCKNKT